MRDARFAPENAHRNHQHHSLSLSPLFARQIELEKEMADRGRDRYYTTVARNTERNAEANTSYGKMLLNRGIEPMARAISEFMESAKQGGAGRRHKAVGMLEGMDVQVVAFIALRKVLDTFSQSMPYQRVSILVGREVEMEKKLTELKEQDPDRYRMTQRYIAGSKARKYRRTVLNYAFGKSTTVEYEPWAEADCLHLGQKLIELAMESCGIFHLVQVPSQKVKGKTMFQSTHYSLEPTPSCREWVERHKDHASMMYPDYLPTLIEPKPWEGAGGGGYYSDALPRLSLVKTGNLGYLEALDKRIQAGEMDTVINAVNALQNTGWSINPTVFEVASYLWDETDGGVAGLPPRDGYRLPPCPTCGADLTDTAAARVRHTCLDALPLEDFNEWKKEAFRIRELNISLFGQRIGVAKTLTMAARFKDEPRFFFPYQLDFRGRIYAVPSYLTPQGTDLAKGLLRFAEGKPLGTMQAVRWLAIHGSNCFGNDKVSLDDRHSWVLQHQQEILECAEDPFSHAWWHEADEPFCFLAFCLEWAGYVREGLDFVSHIPVAMDGTCNGLQIFSLILRDKVGGSAVNLLPAAKPQDIYQIVADKVIGKLKTDAADPDKDAIVTTKEGKAFYNPAKSAAILLDMGINRKTTKRQVMVLPYGGTKESCREYSEEWVKDTIRNGYPQLPEDVSIRGLSFYLSTHVWDAIGETVIAARDAMKYLQDMAGVMNKLDLPIKWTTPAGFPVVQKYMDKKERRIKTKIGDSIVYLNIKEESSVIIDKNKQKSAISPNYVHSLDAAALMKTVNGCLAQNIGNFAMIHDSYGTHAADSVALAATLRRTFVEMFGGEGFGGEVDEVFFHDARPFYVRKENQKQGSRCWRSFRTFLSCPLRAIWMSAKSPIPPSFSPKYQKSYFP
mgnify:CR=1 FL=1